MTTLDELRAVAQRLREAHAMSTKGQWQKGLTTHDTVTETGYKIGNFHHADDANFCDVAHADVPVLLESHDALIAEVERLDAGWHKANGETLSKALETKQLREALEYFMEAVESSAHLDAHRGFMVGAFAKARKALEGTK